MCPLPPPSATPQVSTNPEDVAQTLFLVFGDQAEGQVQPDDVKKLKTQLVSLLMRTETLKYPIPTHPIKRVPSSVLARVFAFTQDQPHPFPYSPKQFYSWLVVTRVCQEWRGIALSTPSLWSTIRLASGRDPLGHMSIALCGDFPATVYYQHLPVLGSKAESRRAAIKFPPRLNVVALHIDTTDPSACGGLDVFEGLPEGLTAFSIGPLARQSYGSLHDLPPLLLPTPSSLKSLTLGNVREWPSSQFGGLTHLTLFRDQSQHAHLPLDEYLALLRPLRSLSILRLIGIEPTAPPTPLTRGSSSQEANFAAGQVDDLVLPNLTLLEIGEWKRPSSLIQFLQALDIPRAATRRIWNCPVNEIGIDKLFSSDRNFPFPSLSRLIITDVSSHQSVVGYCNDTIHIRGSVWPSSYISLFESTAFSAVSDFVFLPPDDKSPCHRTLQRIFEHLPSLTALTISGASPVCLGRVALALGILDDDSDQPNLKEAETTRAPCINTLNIIRYPPARSKAPIGLEEIDLTLLNQIEGERIDWGWIPWRVNLIGLHQRPSQHVNSLGTVRCKLDGVKMWISDVIQLQFHTDIDINPDDDNEWGDVQVGEDEMDWDDSDDLGCRCPNAHYNVTQRSLNYA